MSSSDPEVDYLVIGQGIGGTSIAWHLAESGKSFHIVGDSSAPSSSRVAAGIFNPLTGKKLVKTWLADELFPYASAFYSDLEKKLNADFLHPMSVFRPFRSIEEQNTYLAQSADKSILPYIGDNKETGSVSDYVHAAFGGLEVIRSGWVDLPLLLDKSKEYFALNEQYIEAKFDFADLQISADHISWKGTAYGKIILCQGFAATRNHLFNWLPFTPVKGQLLEIATEEALKPFIVNQGIFILPSAGRTSKVGATYSWDPLDWEVTEEAAQELENKLRSLLIVPYEITGQAAGIRPSVRDRRPLIGVHPDYRNVCIFNGLGTKGVTLAPFFANQFIRNLENGKELNPLVNIQRYFSLYFR
jgi:glycine/D-amino acid oxidase-like deaminating enzyme